MESTKLLSVVVPTKNRYKYLKYLIELIASFKSDEIELVIQDNSDDNTEFVSFLDSQNYDFISYNYIKGQIPMAINSDKAILNSTGEYVCFLGDDDGVTEDIIDCVKWMRSKNIEAAKSFPASYCWPEVKGNRFIDMGGRAVFKKASSPILYLNPLETLYDSLSKGFVNRGKLPLVYHGIVKRSTLDKIYEIGGTYFPGSSPDISNAVALSLICKTFVQYNKIIVFSGASSYHGGGVNIGKRKRHPDLVDIKWLLPGAVEEWDNRLPKIGEAESIWCDSAIKSLKYMGRGDLIDKINFEYLYLQFALSHKDLMFTVFSLSKKKWAFCFVYPLLLLKRYFCGARSLVYGKFELIPGKKSKKGIFNTMEAANYFHLVNKCKCN